MAWERHLGPKYLDEPLPSMRLLYDPQMEHVWARAMARGQQLASGAQLKQDGDWLQEQADKRTSLLDGDREQHIKDLSSIHAAGTSLGWMAAKHRSSTAALQAKIDQTWQPYASTNLPHHNGWVRAARRIRSVFQQLTGRQREPVVPRRAGQEQAAPPPYAPPPTPTGPPPAYSPGSVPDSVTRKPLPEKPLPEAPLPLTEAAAYRIMERDKALMAPLRETLARAGAQAREQQAQAAVYMAERRAQAEVRMREQQAWAEPLQLAKDAGYEPEVLASIIQVRSDDAPHRASATPLLPAGFDRDQARPHTPARQQDPAAIPAGPNVNRNPNTAPARRGPGR